MTEVAHRTFGVGQKPTGRVQTWANYMPNPMAAATVITPTPTTVHLPNSPSISPRIPEFSRAEVAEHCEIHSCWIIVSDKVYDVTQFIQEHPGGLDVIMEYAGRDATVAFMDKGHSKDAWMLLTDFYLGDMVKEDRIMK